MSKKKRKHTNQKVYQVPSNAELDKIKENPLLNDIVKDDMITLHKINKGLKSMVMDVINGNNLNEVSDKAEISRIDIMTPHVVYPEDTEYITSEVESMVNTWFIDVTWDRVNISQAFMICIELTDRETNELYGNLIYIHAIPSDMSNESLTISTLALVGEE